MTRSGFPGGAAGALEGIGLTDFEMDQALAAVLNHAAHTAALEAGLFERLLDGIAALIAKR